MAKLDRANPDPLTRSVLRVHPVASRMIDSLISQCPDEVGGFGYVTLVSPGVFELQAPEDVFICDQVVTPVSVEYDNVGMHYAHYLAIKAGRVEELKLRWHSHPGTGPRSAYFSGTDMQDIENLGGGGAEWWVSLVFDRTGRNYCARVDTFRPIRAWIPLTLERLRIEGRPDYRGVDRQCRAMLANHVTRRILVQHGKQTTTVEIGVFDPLPEGAVAKSRR
jgi:hypothetical protein